MKQVTALKQRNAILVKLLQETGLRFEADDGNGEHIYTMPGGLNCSWKSFGDELPNSFRVKLWIQTPLVLTAHRFTYLWCEYLRHMDENLCIFVYVWSVAPSSNVADSVFTFEAVREKSAKRLYNRLRKKNK